MRDEELKQLVESNARAIQAMLDERVEDRLRYEDNMAQLRDAILRLTEIQHGMVRMLASLDEDRPTISALLQSGCDRCR